MTAELTDSLIVQYNTAEENLALLQNSNEELWRLNRKIWLASLSRRQEQIFLNQTKQSVDKLKKRVSRNANPRFLHYLVPDRAAKLLRLKKELQQKLDTESTQLNNLAEVSADLAALEHQQEHIRELQSTQDHLENVRRALFDRVVAVVDTQQETSVLKSLRVELDDQQLLLVSESTLLTAITNCAAMMQQSLCHFEKAQSIYERTSAANETAMPVTGVEASEPCCEEVPQRRRRVKFERKAVEEVEHSEKRNKLLLDQRAAVINEAQYFTMRAYQHLGVSFACFPREARSRCPELCTSIDQAAFPHLHMFEGTFNTFGFQSTSVSSGRNPWDDMRVVEQCASITNATQQCAQQIELSTKVQATLTASINELQVNIPELQAKLQAERRKLFDIARSS